MDLTSDRLLANACHGANLIWAISAEIAEFMCHSQFSTDFFLDYLRQYACIWSRDNYLKPPSGANDYTSIERDLILFDELITPANSFLRYHHHVRQVFSVLMPHEIAALNRAISFPSLETLIYQKLNYNRWQLAQLSFAKLDELLSQNPWLSVYIMLYQAQKELSHIHSYSLQFSEKIFNQTEKEQRSSTR